MKLEIENSINTLKEKKQENNNMLELVEGCYTPQQELALRQVANYLTKVGEMNKYTPLNKSICRQFMLTCLEHSLNPILNDIYLLDMKGNWTIFLGYQVYIRKALESKDLEYWIPHYLLDNENNLKGIKMEIKRKSHTQPTQLLFMLEEWKRKEGSFGIWNQKPTQMLLKVAIAQTFRIAFNDVFSKNLNLYGYEEQWDTNKEIKDTGNVNMEEKNA